MNDVCHHKIINVRKEEENAGFDHYRDFRSSTHDWRDLHRKSF